jgi:hypothetical protein
MAWYGGSGRGWDWKEKFQVREHEWWTGGGPSTATKFRENCGERTSDILPKACKVRASELIGGESGTRPPAID